MCSYYCCFSHIHIRWTHFTEHRKLFITSAKKDILLVVCVCVCVINLFVNMIAQKVLHDIWSNLAGV